MTRRRWPIRFTRFGTYYILFSLAVGAAAINTSNNLLYLMLGLLLGFIIISGILSDSCLWGLRAEFIPASDLYAGQPAEWDIVARKGWFPGIIVRIEAAWDGVGGEASTRHLFFWIPRHDSRRLRVSITPPRRGLFHLHSLRYSTQFPFGLFEKFHQWPSTDSWVVFPSMALLSLSALRAAGAVFSDQPAERKGHGATPFDLRPYQRGDSSKKIHWKSSAKRGALMVTEMEEESGIGQLIQVSAWPDSAELEVFIVFVASLVYTLYKQGYRVGLHAPGASFDAGTGRAHLKKILTYLALVNPGQETPSIAVSRGRNARAIDAREMWGRYRHAR